MTRPSPLSSASGSCAFALRALPAALLLLLGISTSTAEAKDLTSASGTGDAYAILGKSFTIETPDCGHKVPHITQTMDDTLKKGVFVYHLHVKAFLDNDRCGATDRQRTEIRAKSTDIVANEGDTIYYNWKFKLPAGFQTSTNFTHIMQIKSDQAAPILTLTPRGTNLSTDGRFGVHGTTELAKFLDTWVVARMKVVFSHSGSVALTINRLSDGASLFSYTGPGNMWDDNSGGGDFKAGIYRSLTNKDVLRDEDDFRFADFCGSKTSAADCEDGTGAPSDAGVGPEGDAGGSNPADAGSVEPDAAGTGEPDAGTEPPATGGTSGGGSGGGAGGGGSSGSGGGSGGEGSGEAGSGGSRPAGRDAGASSGGRTGTSGSSGGCAIGDGATPGPLALGVAGFVALVITRRRRHRGNR